MSQLIRAEEGLFGAGPLLEAPASDVTSVHFSAFPREWGLISQYHIPLLSKV